MTSGSSNLSKSKKRARANGQGSIYYIAARQCWGASIHDYNNKRVTKNFNSEEEAFCWLAEQRKAKSLGLYTALEPTKVTLAEYLLDWVERNQNHKKPATNDFYRGRINNQIIPVLGHLKLTSVTPRAIEDLISKMIGKGASAAIVKGTYRTLSAALSDGFRLGDLPQNPMAKVKMPRLYSIPRKQIPKSDAALIYQCATHDPYMHARIEIGMISGLRPGEVLGLKWSDVDWEKSTLTISRQVQRVTGQGLVFQSVKQGRERTIVLSSIQIDILIRHLMAQDAKRSMFKVDENLIFPNLNGGKMEDRRDSRMWKQLLRQAGVGNYQRYQMRKTAFSNLYAVLGNVRQLMDYSGHSQVSTVMNSYVFGTEDTDELMRKSIDAIRPDTYEPVLKSEDFTENIHGSVDFINPSGTKTRQPFKGENNES